MAEKSEDMNPARNENSNDVNKRVDESWKEAVEKEREKDVPPDKDEAGVEVTFNLFITGLMMEALIALGEVENPVTKKKETNPTHAKFIIDTLGMLQEKTTNNLSKDEKDMLDSMLYDLRMRFVNLSKK